MIQNPQYLPCEAVAKRLLDLGLSTKEATKVSIDLFQSDAIHVVVDVPKAKRGIYWAMCCPHAPLSQVMNSLRELSKVKAKT